jgi:hypothetical protein
MCGLFGWSFEDRKAIPDRWQVAATLLAYEMDDRGRHSWGHFSSEGGLVKGLGYAISGMNFRRLATRAAVIAHTRFKTIGDPTVENAHPFRFDNIVGAHNGSVNNWFSLNKEYGRDLPVDSMQIFAHLAEGRSLEDVKAYGAIEYFDLKEPDAVYLARFFGGQLAIYGIGKDSDSYSGVVWASTEKAVRAALASCGLDGFLFQMPEDRLFWAQRGKLYITEGKLSVGRPEWIRGRNNNYTGARGYNNYGGTQTTDAWRKEYEERQKKEREERNGNRTPTLIGCGVDDKEANGNVRTFPPPSSPPPSAEDTIPAPNTTSKTDVNSPGRVRRDLVITDDRLPEYQVESPAQMNDVVARALKSGATYSWPRRVLIQAENIGKYGNFCIICRWCGWYFCREEMCVECTALGYCNECCSWKGDHSGLDEDWRQLAERTRRRMSEFDLLDDDDNDSASVVVNRVDLDITLAREAQNRKNGRGRGKKKEKPVPTSLVLTSEDFEGTHAPVVPGLGPVVVKSLDDDRESPTRRIGFVPGAPVENVSLTEKQYYSTTAKVVRCATCHFDAPTHSGTCRNRPVGDKPSARHGGY